MAAKISLNMANAAATATMGKIDAKVTVGKPQGKQSDETTAMTDMPEPAASTARAVSAIKISAKPQSMGQKFISQPLRFSSRRVGDPVPVCVTSAAAAEMFAPQVCMTSDGIDTEARFVELALPYNYSELINKSLGSMAKETEFFNRGSQFTHHTQNDGAVIISISEAAQQLTSEKGMDETCKSKPFRAFKLGTPGHVSLALLDVEQSVVEIFDVGAGAKSSVLHLKVIQQLFKPYPYSIRINILNDTFLQKEDQHCQTWIYYFIWKRIVGDSSGSKIVEELQGMTAMERFQLINEFWHFLVRSGGKTCTTEVSWSSNGNSNLPGQNNQRTAGTASTTRQTHHFRPSFRHTGMSRN